MKKSHLRKCLIEAHLESRPITVPDTHGLWAPKPSFRQRTPTPSWRSWSTIIDANLQSRPITIPDTGGLWTACPSPRQPVLARDRPGRVSSPARPWHPWKAIADYLWIAILVVLALLAFALVTPWSPYRVYAVRSGSMYPIFKVGDVILVGPRPATLQEGMIVSFQSGDSELTTHRIVAIMEGGYLQTKGDANEEPDANLVPLDKVEKAFIFRIPYLGYVGHFIRTPLGWLLFVITPAALIIYGEIKNIVATLRPAHHPVGRKTR